MNKTNVHIKVESLVKEGAKIVDELAMQGPRSIIWWDYAISCIFSGVFKKIKKRLKDTLKLNVRYVDGDTPADIQRYLQNFNGINEISMSDANKMDSTIDNDMLQLESFIYQKFGLPKDMAQ